MTRQVWVLVHRYAGLYMALFLTVAGLTGSVLAFHHDLDHWLNPRQYRVPVQARAMLDPFELREQAQTLAPLAQFNFVSFRRVPGEIYTAGIEPRTDPATGKPYKLGYNMLRLNPYTGELIEFGKDEGYWPLTRKNILDFIMDLHYRLALGDVGMWLFGIAALIWTLDCFVGFYLTLPTSRKQSHKPAPIRDNIAWSDVILAFDRTRQRGFWQRWAIAWKIKWRGSAYRVNFDLHRAGGLWTWAMLLVFAWSAVSMNLRDQVYQPVMHVLFGLPDFKNYPRPPLSAPRPNPAIAWRTAYTTGQRLMAGQAQQLGFKTMEEESLSYDASLGLYSYSVMSDHNIFDHWGATSVFFDGDSGALLGVFVPSGQNAGVTLTLWLFVLHTAAVWGLPYQIAVCCMGLLVAILSVTGVYLWLKKRRVAKMKQCVRSTRC